MAPKIIVAEDNESIRAVIRMTLEIENYDVIDTDNGRDALEAVRKNPDCVLLITDLAMPVMDGFELMEQIRGQMENTDLPIYVLSAEKDASTALEHGATRVIRKPFSPVDLLEAVKRALQPPEQ